MRHITRVEGRSTTHDLHLLSLDVLHFGTDPCRQRVESKRRHHANNGTPSEHLVQECNAQNDLERHRDEQHGETPPDIGRNKIRDLPDGFGALLRFLLLTLIPVFAPLVLDAVYVGGGWRGLYGKCGGGGFIRPSGGAVHSCTPGDGGGVRSGRFGRRAIRRGRFSRL